MQIGVLNGLTNGGDCFEHVSQFGLKVCQLVSWDAALATPEVAAIVRRSARKARVRICGMWSGTPGAARWNFLEGPATLGLVPPEYRWARITALKKFADFAAMIGAPAIITHCGFIPENPTDPMYPGVIVAIREVAAHCRMRGIEFWFETGQETPVTLLRTIERVETGNLGINLDPANLVMYGKGNPVDALDVFGKYVRNLHVKDGLYPTDGDRLGREVQVGEGKVNFPELLKKLRKIGFRGELIIEREIKGAQQTKDIAATVKRLRRWLGKKS